MLNEALLNRGGTAERGAVSPLESVLAHKLMSAGIVSLPQRPRCAEDISVRERCTPVYSCVNTWTACHNCIAIVFCERQAVVPDYL